MSGSDEARRKILARRATFVAAALAGMSTACGKEPTKNPEPCLSVPIQHPPEPCLSPVAQPPPDAGPDAGEKVEDAGAFQVPPLPCLSVIAAPEDAGTPKPCLKIAPPATQTARPHPTALPLPCLTPKRPEDVKK